MAEVIRMPKMSDTMTDGTIAAWHKKVGDKVKSGDLLAEVETDKATMELESYENGTLLYIGVQEKNSVPVDGLIAIIGKEGEDISALISGGQNTSPAAPAETPNASAEVAPSIDTSNIKASVIRMPKMSDTMTEGTIAAWHKKVGDKVKSGELLAEVETDKATMELESYEDGTLLYIGVEAGSAIVVDGIIAVIGEAGADFQTLIKAQLGSSSQTVSAAKTEEPVQNTATTASAPVATTVSTTNDARLKASPLAKSIAKEKGVNIADIKGSGENGRVVKSDVENFTPATSSNATSSSKSTPIAYGVESYEEFPVSQMRKAIAKSLSNSLFTAPHFYLAIEVDMDKAIEARASINEVTAPVKISFNDIVIKAVAVALKKHPKINSSWQGDKIRVNNHIHIGVAMAVEDGLLVPVVRFTDSKSLAQISTEVKEYSVKAKNKKLQPADWEGNTFTISNLGMFGIEEFTSILNAPEACILSVGGIKQTPVVKNGQIVPGNIMKLNLGCDHRVVDGAVGAAFLQTLKGLLEDPIRLLA